MRGIRLHRFLVAVLVGALMVEVLATFTLAAVGDNPIAVREPSDAPSGSSDLGSAANQLGTEPRSSTSPGGASTAPPTSGPSGAPGQGPFEITDPSEAPGSQPGSTPTLTPVPTPIPATPPPPPPPPTNFSANCASMPGEPAGWTRRVTSTFSETTPVGSWPGPVAAQGWRNRQGGSDSSGRGTYDSGKTVSEHDGVLDIFIHSEGTTRYVAAVVANLGDTYGQRISVCMRADRIPGYKHVFMLWPGSGDGNSRGEIDYPEGKLTPDGVGNAFMHYDPKPASDPKQDAYSTGMSTVDWHVYTIEWDPGSSAPSDDYAAFFVDGRLIGRSTGSLVPDGPMHYLIQTETYVAGQALPAPASGHVLIDWITISTPN